ncbi:nuclease NucT [Serratia rubidaea]|uniref:Nuclease NucT n=1 Tax=Serratia rubidaea TaxID=61652 RepID=A0A4U9H983_SERRU|nr:nuclease NucT [Serratia rubidaea]
MIDNALRSAAARGVQVELMVADWNTKKPEIDYLKSLALLPNVQLKVVTIPVADGGFIPYARVIHSKIMTIDERLAWVGTSNWSGGYLDNSRNLELVLNNEALAARLDGCISNCGTARMRRRCALSRITRRRGRAAEALAGNQSRRVRPWLPGFRVTDLSSCRRL